MHVPSPTYLSRKQHSAELWTLCALKLGLSSHPTLLSWSHLWACEIFLLKAFQSLSGASSPNRRLYLCASRLPLGMLPHLLMGLLHSIVNCQQRPRLLQCCVLTEFVDHRRCFLKCLLTEGEKTFRLGT